MDSGGASTREGGPFAEKYIVQIGLKKYSFSYI